MKKTQQAKERIKTYLKQKVDQAIQKRLDQMPAFIKQQMADPDMPHCVARAQNTVIDEFWKDAKQEIMVEVGIMLDGKVDAPEKSPPPNCCSAFWRYHLFPYDKTIWGKLRDPVFVMFKILTAIPVLGIAPLMYLFIFLIIDKRDEFQLIDFVLMFKGMQFVTLGIVRAFLGFFLYYGCTIGDEDDHTCEESGPGAGADFLGTSVGLLICVVLCWSALLLLPWSKEKGRVQTQGSLDHQHAPPGGRLRPLLWWDLFAAVLSVGIVAFLFSGMGHGEMWRIRANMYWAQIVYGIFAAPFFVYTLPVISKLMTHSVTTAYDEHGCCVPPKPPPKAEKREDPADDVSDQDVDNMISALMKP